MAAKMEGRPAGRPLKSLFFDSCSLLYPLTDTPENDSTASPRTG